LFMKIENKLLYIDIIAYFLLHIEVISNLLI